MTWPSELRLSSDKTRLTLTWDDGRHYALPAEYLRVMSPSAEVQGHSAAERKTVGGKRHVRIVSIEPVGTYAARLVFDDGHATGLYTWGYLEELGRDQSTRWAGYLAQLAAKGLSRDLPGER